MEWREELDRTCRRLANLHALVTKPEPKVGQTPREEVYKKNKSRLYRYASSRRHATPLLFVPNLGISRPYIFDLLPGGSFIEHMTREGFDFYLLDWGNRKSTRLNSSHITISYAVFCLKKKKKQYYRLLRQQVGHATRS